MKYTKEQKQLMLKEIAKLRLMNFTWKQVEEYLKKQYGIKDLTQLRKEYEVLDRNMLIENKLDTHDVIDLQAKVYNKVLIEQKKTTKMRNQLHYETNVIAFRDRITDILEGFKWDRYGYTGVGVKTSQNQNKPLNRGVFLIADEHFKGKCDIKHLNNLYDCIENDIKARKYDYVELWYLGDGIDGLIHLGSLQSNDGTIQPAIQYINILIERVNKIKQVKAIKFVAQSNHTETRALGTNRSELAQEDINYMLINTMKYGLRKDIKLLADKIMMFEYEKLNFALIHGHQKYARTRAKTLEYWNSKYGYIPDVIIMGHWHSFKQTEYGLNRWMIVCPAVKKYNGCYEDDMGFVSTGQYLIMEIENGTPQVKIRTLED